MIDAEAIAEAATRPTMRFVAIKRSDHVNLQALRRIRDQMAGSRTRLICQMRAFRLEYGVPIRQGADVFKLDLPRVLSDEANCLTPAMSQLLSELFADLGRLDQRRTTGPAANNSGLRCPRATASSRPNLRTGGGNGRDQAGRTRTVARQGHVESTRCPRETRLRPFA